MSISDLTSNRTRVVTWGDPLESADAATQMSGLDFLRAMADGRLPAPPLLVLLGLRLTEVEEGRVVFSVEPAEYHYNPVGVVHGGLTSTLCDSAMACAVHSTLPVGVGSTTLELKVNFTRPITVATGILSCEARTVHVGRTQATAEARVTAADGQLYAHATTTCLILRRSHRMREEG